MPRYSPPRDAPPAAAVHPPPESLFLPPSHPADVELSGVWQPMVRYIQPAVTILIVMSLRCSAGESELRIGGGGALEGWASVWFQVGFRLASGGFQVGFKWVSGGFQVGFRLDSG